MRKRLAWFIFAGFLSAFVPLYAQQGTIPAFEIETGPITLERPARPGTPFDKVGRKFAILADESGTFEAWAYPLKLFRNFTFSFLVGNSTTPIQGKDVVRYVSVTPAATTLTYTYQSFTVKAIYITPVEEPGAIVLLQVDSISPLTIVCGFLPVLQPMWPAGLGGQFSYWSDERKAYIISEPKGQNHGMIGSQAAQGLSYTPAHMLSDAPNEFKIEIADPDRARDKFIPICMAGGNGSREDVLKVYEKLQAAPESYYRLNLAHYTDLRENTLRVKTPNIRIDLAFEWAKVAFDNLLVENPDLGKGMVAGLGASGTSGRPGFGWFFGGDTYINSLSLVSYGARRFAREALAFTQKWQRKDGKMAHELSQAASYIDWWKDYHYGYIHGDTTPYYIAALYDYVRMTGDDDFIRRSWDSLKKAYQWCLSTDTDGDGLMDNRKAGLGALEYGELTGIETDIYLAAVWVRAVYAMQYLAEIAGERALAEEASVLFHKAKQAFDQKFWDEENEFYAYAFNAEGQTVKEISPWSAVGMMWNLGTEEHSLSSLEKISSSELVTDWGIRSISVDSRYFQPLNYNYGAVWPFLTSWVTTALYKHHLPLQAYNLLMSTVDHTFDHGLGTITEVFSGTNNIWPQEAVSHQGFSSAGAVLPLVRGLLGLEGNAPEKTVTFSPHFPGDWKRVDIDNYAVGQAKFSFDYAKEPDKITVRIQTVNAAGYTIRFAPALGVGSGVRSLILDGKPQTFRTDSKAQVVIVESDWPVLESEMAVELDYVQAVEILPSVPQAGTGERNKGLKIVSLKKETSRLVLDVEGLAQKRYELEVMNPEGIAGVEGAELKGNKLLLACQEGEPGHFVAHRVIIHLKNELIPK
jgi:hypothetical protein